MAKQCDVCQQSYSDDLESCPHCAAAQLSANVNNDDEVDLGEIFGDGEDDLSRTQERRPAGKNPVKTMMAMPVDEDAVDLGKGKVQPEATPSQRPKTMHVTPDEMAAVAQGEAPGAASVLDSASAVDLGADDSSVNLGSSEHLGSADKLQGGRLSSLGEEAPTVEHMPSEDMPVVEHAADEDDDMPVVEHAAEEDEVAEESPPPKKKSGSRTWVAGAAGMVLGSAATLVLAILNLLPFVSSGGDGSPRPASAPVQPIAPAPVASAAPAVTPEQYLAYGDFAKAAEAFGAQETQEPAMLVKRAQARWLAYLQEKKQAKAPLKKDDEAVAQSVKDLADAKTAEAVFWLGLIEESTSGPAAARKIYQDGAAKFKQPTDQQLFQSALDRLDAETDAPAARQAWRAPRVAEAALALAITLQEPAALAPQEPPAPAAAPNQEPAPPAQPTKPVEEAGADFWKALRLAKEHKYADALAAIAKARNTHDQQRFSRLYKAQNPVTDPTETIFLRTCDELAAYWRMRQALAGAGYLAQGKSNDPVAALNAALAAGKQSQGPNKALASLAELLKKDKDVVAADPEVKDVAKAIETLAAAKQRGQSELAAAQAALTKANAGAKERELEAAQATTKLLAEKKAAADLAAQTEKKLAQAEASLKNVAKQLDDTKYAQATQSRTHGPRQMLEIWLPVLTQDRIPVSRSLCDTAARDGKLVADERSLDAATRGLALGVQGLALRGLGRYDEAKQSLAAALETDKSPLRAGDWRFPVQQARRALADPLAYYVPEARRAAARGQYDQALARLDEGLGAFPKNTPAGGALLAERSAVLLAQAQSQGKLTRDNPRAVEAGNDAKAAIAAKATAEGAYALGRWHEALGELDQARQAYEQAVAAHPALDVAGGRYRVALAQLLARQYGPKMPVRDDRRVHWTPFAALIGLVVAQDEEQEIKLPPELDRAVQLADEAIQAGNAEGYLVKAVALAGKHRWTDAIIAYSRGLEKITSPAQAARPHSHGRYRLRTLRWLP